jgi:serine/threonine protein kinase
MAKVVIGIILGMRFIHSRGIIVRNLRPEIIFLDSDGNAKIGGFMHSTFHETASWLEIEATTEASFYLAPEVRRGKITPAVDVYSFSLILYELLVSVPVFDRSLPFEAYEESVKKGARPDLPEDMSPAAKDLISSGWSSDPDCRCSFDAMVSDLENSQWRVIPTAGWECCCDYADFIQFAAE